MARQDTVSYSKINGMGVVQGEPRSRLKTGGRSAAQRALALPSPEEGGWCDTPGQPLQEGQSDAAVTPGFA